jgi:hypothetical protein
MQTDPTDTRPVHLRARYWVLDLDRAAPNNVRPDGSLAAADGYLDSSENFDEAAFFAREHHGVSVRTAGAEPVHRFQVVDSAAELRVVFAT